MFVTLEINYSVLLSHVHWMSCHRVHCQHRGIYLCMRNMAVSHSLSLLETTNVKIWRVERSTLHSAAVQGQSMRARTPARQWVVRTAEWPHRRADSKQPTANSQSVISWFSLTVTLTDVPEPCFTQHICPAGVKAGRTNVEVKPETQKCVWWWQEAVVLVAALVFRLYKHQTYLLLIFLVPRSLCRFLLLHSLLKWNRD